MWFYPCLIMIPSAVGYLYASFPRKPVLTVSGTFEATMRKPLSNNSCKNIHDLSGCIPQINTDYSKVHRISIYEYESNTTLDCDSTEDVKNKFVTAQKLRLQHAKFPWNKILWKECMNSVKI